MSDKLIHVCRHEAAHIAALDAMGGRFYYAVIQEIGVGTFTGAVVKTEGPLQALLVASVAGAVFDSGSSYCGRDGWKNVLEHMRSSVCCSGDLAEAKRVAGLIDAGRSLAQEAINTAIHTLHDQKELWLETSRALFLQEWDYPADDVREKRLWHWRDYSAPIPGCPYLASDFCDIREQVRAEQRSKVGAAT